MVVIVGARDVVVGGGDEGSADLVEVEIVIDEAILLEVVLLVRLAVVVHVLPDALDLLGGTFVNR